ncbi:para-aminobenzoate synthase [Delitschia confertaspora ATCC 74209]|uniref:aminodeoxychorismate synthase n=1 Tax=Delitschia confertaspora ATCC 74209 TaxID=1513339 RepID=A0A9P4N0A4_9PLEO|nr:para-aminobenzoate synthase [Delitschia confertaspora ATCC 74209]
MPALLQTTPVVLGPEILFVDAFDSFTNNIIGLLEQCLHAHVTIVRIDDHEIGAQFPQYLRSFDAVIIGPGPGHPGNRQDVGLINKLWTLQESDILPIFGICLGFQSMCLAHGASMLRLPHPRHGIVSKISHGSTDIFANIGTFYATQYHSLHVDLGDVMPIGMPSTKCPSLIPLAWDLTDVSNGPILMGAKHVSKPFWGVQFHPESICTSKEAVQMISNWWTHAKAWSKMHQRLAVPENKDGACRLASSRRASSGGMHGLENHVAGLLHAMHGSIGTSKPLLRWAKHQHQSPSITPVALCEALGLHRDEVVVLDSQGHSFGRYSIIGIVIPGQTLKVTYKSWDRTLRYGTGSGDQATVQLDSIDQVWPILQTALDAYNPNQARSRPQTPESSDSTQERGMDTLVEGHPPQECPFWGGFMGYISYEAGLETIRVDLHESCAKTQIPDVNFAFVHRSIVIDHHTGSTYVQSLSPNDWGWILEAGRTIDALVYHTEVQHSSSLDQHELERRLKLATIKKPTEWAYRRKVLQCQDSLAVGDSYELCLTDETILSIPKLDSKPLDAWSLYKKLRRRNPAPFGAFLRLSSAVIVGSSPERFLRWDRAGHCQLRPIKGTVKKGPYMTREKAHAILNTSKERAENLMIVDLIRHDLSSVVGAENCKVSKLMTVEEYETVYQLVSVIEGQLPHDSEATGLDVLKASLPPGSMTGAPKKRSCEILRDLEKRPRGIYAGVLGYLDIGGAGDFSVVIRTTERLSAGRDIETWRISAGGAVTIQSTDQGEFLEMETKAESALSAFI